MKKLPFVFFFLIILMLLSSFLAKKPALAQLPPPNVSCDIHFAGMDCPANKPTPCTDGVNYDWCCTNERACNSSVQELFGSGNITPPAEADCSVMVGGSCAATYIICTDSASYWWCCTNAEACAQAAEDQALPPPKSLDTDEVKPDYYEQICQGKPGCLPCLLAEKSWTAFGCLPTNEPQEFITWLLGAAIGIAGGIAVLLMIFGGFLIILSSGDPQKLQTGKDILTSAIIGLVVIIFSVFLLRIIGVEILKIPGFG